MILAVRGGGGGTHVFVQVIVLFNDVVSFQDNIASVMNERVGNVGETVQREESEVLGEKYVPVSSPHIPHEHPWDPTRASALRCWGLPF
jgi:hypothetical protein